MERRLRAPFRRHLGMESLEHRRLLATLYVDNPGDYAVTTNNVGGPGADNGDIVTWNPGAGSQHPGPVAGLTYGTNAFGTINDAVTAATAGDTIRVAGGTFNESVNVNKQLLVLGNQVGVDAQTGRVGAPETIVDSGGSFPFILTASDAEVNGFTIQGGTNGATGFGVTLSSGTAGSEVRNNIIQNNIAGLSLANNSAADQTIIERNLFRNNNVAGPVSGTGIYTDQFSAGGTLTNVLIDSNTFTGNGGPAVNLGSTLTGSQSNITVSCNTITSEANGVLFFNTTSSTISGNTITGSAGSQIGIFDGSSNILITQNFIDNGATRGIRIENSGGGPNSLISINRNHISGNATAGLEVGATGYTGGPGSLNAEFNWWGSATGPTIASNPGGTGDTIIDSLGQVDYVPFLPNGADTDPVDCGFQPSIADLSITKDDSPDPAVPGGIVTYTIVVSNNGPDTQTGATVADPFSAQFTSVTYTSVGSAGVAGNTLSGSGDINDTVTIPASGTITYTVTGNIAASASGSITNTATVTAPRNTFETNLANNSDTEVTTLTPEADLSVTKTDSPDPVIAGQNLTYTVTVSNLGLSDAQTVSLSDAVPVGTTFVSATQTSGPAFTLATPPVGSTGTVSATTPTLAAGATATFTIVVNVNASDLQGSTLSNTAIVTSATTDANAANNTAIETTTVNASADLSVTKTDSPDPVVAGTNLTYTVTVSNLGTSDAQNVTLNDAVPVGTTFVSASQTSGPAFTLSSSPPVGGTGTVTFTDATLAAGATATFTIVVHVNASDLDGSTLTNTAIVASTTTDADAANNTDTETTTVNASADLSVTKTDSPDPVIAGQNLTYTVTVTNLGSSDAQTVSLSDAVPAGTTFVSASQTGGPAFTLSSAPPAGGTGTIIFTDATLAAGATATFTIVVNVNATDPQGSTISNTATVTSATTDVTPGNNSDTELTVVNASADLSVTKTDSPDPVVAGTNLTYTVTVSNLGSSDAQTVSLSDAVPVGTTFVSASQTSGPAFTLVTPPAGGGGTVSATIATLAAGATATFTMVVNVNASDLQGSTLSNTATVSSATTDANAANNADTETTTVNASADLSVTKSDSPDPVIAGNNLTYTITVNNAGVSDAQNVTVNDAVPAGTTFVSATQTSGPAFTLSSAPPVGGTGTVTFTDATLAAGATATFTIVVNVNASDLQGSTITNTAIVGSTTTDANSANNTDTETTTVNAQADLLVTKSDSPDPVIAGQNLTYTITVSNAGASNAQNVSLTDAVPVGTTFVSASQSSGPPFTLSSAPPAGGTGTVTFTDATLAAGATATFTIVVNVNASDLQGTTLSNTAVVTGTTNETNTVNNSDTETTAVNASADLSVTKTDSPDPVTAGQNLTYTIVVTNNGSSDAQTVSLTDAVPANTTFVSFAAPAGWGTTTPAVGGTGTITATNPTLAAGATATFTLVVQVSASAPNGSTITNTVAVASATTDATPANNSDTESTAVVTSADLSVTKSDSPDPVTAGQELTYTIVVTNNGTSDAQGVSLSDLIPADTTFVSFTAPAGWTATTPPVGGTGTVTATTPTLAAGATATFTLVVQVDNLVLGGSVISNTATVSATTSDSNTANNSATETTDVERPVLAECEVLTANSPGSDGTVEVLDDADNPGHGVLIVTGTSRNDTIIIEPRPHDPSQLRVRLNGTVVAIVAASSVQHIVVFGLAGNDTIIVNASLLQPATLFGDEGNDTLYGARGNDGLDGGAGNDRLFGGSGNDTLCGGDGNDTMYGQAGDDFMGGDGGNDRMWGEAGNDLLQGGDGNDSLYGGAGDDRVYGQAGNDGVFGDTGNDIVVGGDGNDKVYGSAGRDLLIGGDGNDTLFGEAHDDILVAGTTIHDEDDIALMAILSEWTSSHSYADRVSNIRDGGGSNGPFVLNDTTVFDDGRADTLWGHGGQDWFLIGVGDRIRDRARNELVN